jgi:hypothetical protein
VRKREKNSETLYPVIIDDVVNKFQKINENNWWQLFKLARMCVRYVYYDIANSLYERMSEIMATGSSNMSANDLRYCLIIFSFKAYYT